MSEKLTKHQLFEYDEKMPFQIFGLRSDSSKFELLESHWHEELELEYCIRGHSKHYINGEVLVDEPGRLIVTNSEFVHSIIPDLSDRCTSSMAVIVILIHRRYLEEIFPEYKFLYFTNDKLVASEQIRKLIYNIYDYAMESGREQYGYVKLKAMVAELIYEMCREGVVERRLVDDINVQRNIERIKGVLQYIENNYTEKISQSDVAAKFYFSTVYFSRYFKKTTGFTFTEYVTEFRLGKAKKELLSTEKSILEIALETGFADERRLIIAFKKKFGTTPLQYRKRQNMT